MVNIKEYKIMADGLYGLIENCNNEIDKCNTMKKRNILGMYRKEYTEQLINTAGRTINMIILQVLFTKLLVSEIDNYTKVFNKHKDNPIIKSLVEEIENGESNNKKSEKTKSRKSTKNNK
jgi:hypothetical protein